MSKRFILDLSESQANDLLATIISAERGREDFEYLVSQNAGDYEASDITARRASHVREVATEAAIRDMLLAPSTPEPEEQQPGTHRVTVEIEWNEVASYKQQVEIDVPDGFEDAGGDVADLVHVDDQFSEAESVPEDFAMPKDYRSNWIDRANWNDVEDVSDRDVTSVIVID